LSRDDLRAVLERGLERFGLAGLVDFDIAITPDQAPDPKTGKLQGITSRVGPPEVPAVRAASPDLDTVKGRAHAVEEVQPHLCA
jgi:hypothetical protein